MPESLIYPEVVVFVFFDLEKAATMRQMRVQTQATTPSASRWTSLRDGHFKIRRGRHKTLTKRVRAQRACHPARMVRQKTRRWPHGQPTADTNSSLPTSHQACESVILLIQVDIVILLLLLHLEEIGDFCTGS